MRGRHRKPKVTARNRRCEIRCITLKDQSREDRGSRAFPVISRSLLQRLSPESRLRMAPLLRFFCFFLRCFFFIYLGLLGRERGPLGGFPSVSFHFPRGRRGGSPYRRRCSGSHGEETALEGRSPPGKPLSWCFLPGGQAWGFLISQKSLKS